VIVGAYVDKRGGVCPMLAAHRNGGRTFGTFAAPGTPSPAPEKARRASRREVRTLEGYLEMALLREGIATGIPPDRPLADEVRDVQAAAAASPRPTPRRLRHLDSGRPRTAYAEHALATDETGPPSGLRRRSVRRARPAEAELHTADS
jgi:hypothetical protein